MIADRQTVSETEDLNGQLLAAEAEVYRLRQALGRPMGAPRRVDRTLARELYATGITLDAIGQAVGCSRERIRQLANIEGWRRSPELLMRPDLSVLFGAVTTGRSFQRLFKGRTFGPDDLLKMKAALSRQCPEPGCQIILGLSRRKRCAPHAAEQYRHRWLRMSPVQRAQHRMRVRRWEQTHPVQSKEIQTRARSKYIAKLKAKTA